MFNNRLNWFYGTDNGFEIYDDVTAEIGFTAAAGVDFSIGIDGTCLKNYSVDESGVTGDVCDNLDGVWGYTTKCNLTKRSSGAEGAPELLTYTIAADSPNIRLAMWLAKNESGSESFISWGIVSYNTQTHQWGQVAPWMYTDMDSSYRMYQIAIPATPAPGYVTELNARLDYITDRYNKVGNYNFPYSTYFEKTRLTTNIPLFDSLQHAKDYLEDETNQTIDGILNLSATDPGEEYEDARKYKHVRNVFGHNASAITGYSGFRNYRFYGGDGKICFYRQTPTAAEPFSLRLYHWESYTVKYSNSPYNTDDDAYISGFGDPYLTYLDKSIQFETNDYYTSFIFDTDIYIFESQAMADDYIADIIDGRSAENYTKVARAYNEILDPGYGNPDEGNDNGINGQSYVHGARLWVMTSSELNHFFDDIFDPVHISDILDGTKLLGDGINAVQGISYFPIDIDDVATVNGTANSIKLGSYTCPTATGRYVWNNNKMIDCGSLFIAPVYNDYRDYKIKLYIYLPYCGFHCLDPISKYMSKNLSVKYAVDITTGGCTAYVYADGIFYGDSFDGFMASQRPLSALDQTAYLNAVMGCVSSIATRETGMINSATEGIAGAASGKVSGGVGPGGALEISMGAVGDLYKLSQAVKDTPMRTRGGFAGCLGFFGNQKIHIVTAQAKTVKPTLEQPLVGYPSHVSQTVGQFSGYLKCSYFKMAAGFNGTLEELKEVVEMMQGGVYL